MTDDDDDNFGFQLLKWPVEVFAFEMVMSFGVLRLLHELVEDPIPRQLRLIAFGLLTTASLVAVIRYMPIDANVFHYKSTIPLLLWNGVTFGFILGVPYISIVHESSTLFWSLALAAAAGKALYGLEELRRKTPGLQDDLSIFEVYRRRTACYGVMASDLKPWKPPTSFTRFLERHFYLERPGFFSLRLLPTCVLLTAFVCSCAVVLLSLQYGKTAMAVAGMTVQSLTSIVYSLLSAGAQARALRRSSEQEIERIKNAATSPTRPDEQQT